MVGLRNLGRIGIVLVGLLVIAQSTTLLYLPLSYIISSSPQPMPLRDGFLLMTPFAVGVLLGLALVIWRNSFATRWFDDSDSEIRVEPLPLLRLGLLLIGMDVVVTGIDGLLQNLANGFTTVIQSRAYADTGGPSVATIVWTSVPGLLARLVPIALGTLLIIYSRQLALRFWPAAEDA